MLQSAGILLYRLLNFKPEFFLVHPGGPYFAKKNAGWWTVPKGEIQPGEEPLSAAIREFREETGIHLQGAFIPLQSIIQKSGKVVRCWALEYDADPDKIISNTFKMEWPPRSGMMKLFPEINKAAWFDLDKAKEMINERQVDFLHQLVRLITDHNANAAL